MLAVYGGGRMLRMVRWQGEATPRPITSRAIRETWPRSGPQLVKQYPICSVITDIRYQESCLFLALASHVPSGADRKQVCLKSGCHTGIIVTTGDSHVIPHLDRIDWQPRVTGRARASKRTWRLASWMK